MKSNKIKWESSMIEKCLNHVTYAKNNYKKESIPTQLHNSRNNDQFEEKQRVVPTIESVLNKYNKNNYIIVEHKEEVTKSDKGKILKNILQNEYSQVMCNLPEKAIDVEVLNFSNFYKLGLQTNSFELPNKNSQGIGIGEILECRQ